MPYTKKDRQVHEVTFVPGRMYLEIEILKFSQNSLSFVPVPENNLRTESKVLYDKTMVLA
jgi:hypothetical protein